MCEFDHDYMDEVVRRLLSLRPEARPLWGKQTGAFMVHHLAATVRYSMGQGGRLPDQSTWFTRHVIAPLVLRGFLGFSWGGRLFSLWDSLQPVSSGDDVETLHAVLEEYLALVQAGELVPPPHPVLGVLGIDGWARFHVLHFDYHLRQFGV